MFPNRFCLDDLSIDLSGILKSPTIIALLFLPLSMLILALYIYISTYIYTNIQMLYIYTNVILSCCIDSFTIM